MEDAKEIEQGFIIDRLTNSILNTVSGDSFHIIQSNRFGIVIGTRRQLFPIWKQLSCPTSFSQ